jgi:uncharacterized protein (TIGR03000 family)
MFFPIPSAARSPGLPRLVLAVPALLLAAAVAWAQLPSKPTEGAVLGHSYNEPRPPTPPPAKVTRPPVRYTITITVFPRKANLAPVPIEGLDKARLVAHLPEDAQLWLEDSATLQRGKERHFLSPPLKRGKKYHYTARVVWFEDGHWVSQTLRAPVWAGRSTCLFIARPTAVTEALDELSPANRKLAAEQKFCAIVPENLLGAMGKPVKVTLKGQPVFVCCKECVKEARDNPDQTLATARELRARNARAPAQSTRPGER